MVRLIAFLILIHSPLAFSAGAAVTYQGRILQPDGSSLNTGSVQFRIQIRTPDISNCLLYEEQRTVSMAGSNGVFALSINGAGATRTDAGVYDFNRLFANKGTLTLPPADCGTTNTYTPSASSGRKVVAMFNVNGSWEALPSMNVNFVPYAVESTTVGGYGSGDLLRVDHLASETVAPFTFADYGKLVDLAAGKLNGSVLPSFTSGQVLGSDGAGGWTAVTPLTAAGLPACATGEYLRVSSGSLVCQAVATSGGTLTSITAGAGLTGGTITTSGTIALATVVSGGTGTKLTYDAYGRVTSAATLAEIDIPTLSASGKINGSAITGTIGNGTAISTSGAIQTSTDLMAGRLSLYDGGGTNTIAFRAPASVTPYVLTYPAAQASAGQTLVNNGSGQLSWVTPFAAVSGAATLSSGKFWMGDVSSKAQEVSMSGDATLSSAGALTLATVPVAKGGTGLTAAATNGQLLIGNGTGYALGTLTAGTGVSVVNSAGGITINATGSGGTVSNVSGTAPIAVATGTSTPVVSIAKSTTSVDGYLAATDFTIFNNKLGTASTFAGDVSGTSAAMSVDKIKGSPLLLTTPASGQYLKYNGTNWINSVIDAADIGTGTLSAARMPAHTGDVTSAAGSTALTLSTVTPAKGGTGLTSIGTANQILGVNTGATGLEYKTITAGSGVSITPAAGTLTITATGSGGTVTNVTSANTDIVVATGTSTPLLTLNSGTSASQIVKLDVAAKLPTVDGSQLINLSTAQFSLGTLPIARGGTNSGTALNNSRLMTSVGGAIVELGAMTDGQLVVGKNAAAPQVVTLSGDAAISNTGALTLNTVPVAKGGTGLTTAATNGQLLIGNGTGYALGTLTAGTGVSVVNSAGGITINATGSGGTVTNVTGTAPIAVATGTSTPVVSIAKSTTSVDGYLAATDFTIFNNKLGTASTFAGDVSGTSAAMSVDKIKGSPLLLTTPASSQYLKYNGTNWINAVIDAADIGTGTLPAARMPAHTGDVTSAAGSTALTLSTVAPAKGGTGLTSIGTANQILGVNTAATGLEYKTVTAGTGVTITPGAGTITINATGSGGTVTNVTSANSDIAVAAGTSTPVLSLNAGIGANQVLKLDGTSKIPAVDGSQVTNLNSANLSAVVPVTKGGTGAAMLAARGVLVGEGTSAVTSSVGAAGTVLQGNGASVDPGFTASPVFGVNATTAGSLGLANGAASGATTMIAPSTSTTAAYTLTLPSSGGTNGYLLQTNGSGVTSWVAPTGSGTVASGSANQLAYYSGAGTAVGGLSSVNSAVLLTNGSGIPAWSTIASDTFTQYGILAGRAGGQAFRGGTAASENLTLDSTANATKGYVLLAPSGGNVGVGTTAPNSSLQVKGSFSAAFAAISANYTLTGADNVVVGSAAGGAITLTLPTAVGIVGRQYTLKKTDGSANAITIATSSSQTIEGVSSLSLSTQWQYTVLTSDGANWVITGGNTSAASVNFTFSNVTGASTNALITSSTVTTTGVGTVSISVSGSGSPQISINGGAWVTSGSLTAGQSLAVRQTSSISPSTGLTATILAGTNSVSWTVTTSATVDRYMSRSADVTEGATSNYATNTVNMGGTWGYGGGNADFITITTTGITASIKGMTIANYAGSGTNAFSPVMYIISGGSTNGTVIATKTYSNIALPTGPGQYLLLFDTPVSLPPGVYSIGLSWLSATSGSTYRSDANFRSSSSIAGATGTLSVTYGNTVFNGTGPLSTSNGTTGTSTGQIQTLLWNY